MYRLSAERAKYLNTVSKYIISDFSAPLAISAASCEGKQTPKNNRELPHHRVNPLPPIFRFFLSFLLLPPWEKTKSGGDPPPRAARGKKDCGCRIGGGREGWRMVVRQAGKAGRKSEGRPPSPLFSISDKNKVNGKWGYRRGGCCSAGVSGRDG